MLGIQTQAFYQPHHLPSLGKNKGIALYFSFVVLLFVVMLVVGSRILGFPFLELRILLCDVTSTLGGG